MNVRVYVWIGHYRVANVLEFEVGSEYFQVCGSVRVVSEKECESKLSTENGVVRRHDGNKRRGEMDEGSEEGE